MFKGTVSFVSRKKDQFVIFPAIEFEPQELGVEKVQIEGPIGEEVRSTIHLSFVASPDEGRATATKVNTAAFDRIVFRFGIVLGRVDNSWEGSVIWDGLHERLLGKGAKLAKAEANVEI